MIITQPGDIFLSANPMALGKAINVVQRVWSKDSKSLYSHGGIIVDLAGTTFEALWTVKNQRLWADYRGEDILVARHEAMNPKTFARAYKWIQGLHGGDWYPFYRLVFHLIPPLAKLSVGRVVCTELIAKFLYRCELMRYYNGVNPDNIHDMVCDWNCWDIVFQGKA